MIVIQKKWTTIYCNISRSQLCNIPSIQSPTFPAFLCLLLYLLTSKFVPLLLFVCLLRIPGYDSVFLLVSPPVLMFFRNVSRTGDWYWCLSWTLDDLFLYSTPLSFWISLFSLRYPYYLFLFFCCVLFLSLSWSGFSEEDKPYMLTLLQIAFNSGIVKGFDRFYRCCWSILCIDSTDTQEHLPKSQISSCWSWLVILYLNPLRALLI